MMNKENETTNMTMTPVVYNNMRNILGKLANEPTLYSLYTMFNREIDPELCWQFFGKGKIPDTPTKKREFLSYAKSVHMNEKAAEILCECYAEELEASREQTVRRLENFMAD